MLTQGLDFPSTGACTARGDDGFCAIHANRKPAMCATVPLVPRQSDAHQHVILLDRARGAGYIGAGCIVPGTRDGLPVLVAGGEVRDPAYRPYLVAHRRRSLTSTGNGVTTWPPCYAKMNPSGG